MSLILSTSFNNEEKNTRYISYSYLKLKKKNLKSKILIDHPWNDYKIFYKDYGVINNIYVKNLNILKKILNKFHNTNKNTRYWEILLGPWLHLIIVAYVEKKLIIEKLLKLKKKIRIIIFDFNNDDFISKDFHHFLKFNLKSENWQNFLFSYILKNKDIPKNIKIYIKKKSINRNFSNEYIINKKDSSKLITFFKINILKIYLMITNFFNKKKRIVFFDTYLGKKNNLKLITKHSAIFLNIEEDKSFKKPDKYLRNKLQQQIHNNYKSELLNFIILNLPSDFIENFKNVGLKVSKIFNNPDVILTNSGFYGSSIKSRYIAESVFKGSKLILSQHGGKCGHHNVNFTDDYETKISDKYLSWGWKNKKYNSIKKCGIIKDLSKIERLRSNTKKKDKIVFFMLQKGRFTKYYDYEINSKCLYAYYSNVCPGYYASLKDELKKKFIFRISKENNHWSEIDYIKSNFNNIHISKKKDEYFKHVSVARICICSYLATTFLEMMAANIPVILFVPFPKKIYNLTTLKKFKIMKKNNIFFENYKDAAKFVNKNWNNIDDWWFSRSVQNARKEFINTFACVNQNILNSVAIELKKGSFKK